MERIYPGSGYKSSDAYAESLSVDGIDLNDEFKYLPDDSVSKPDAPVEQVLLAWIC